MTWGVPSTRRRFHARCRDCEYQDNTARAEITSQAHAVNHRGHHVEVERCEVSTLCVATEEAVS